jgi:hypothetical protein
MISATLIVPACNCAQILAPTLTALQSQTTGNYDIIVVDDGSTDDTLEVAQRFIGPQLSVMACRRQGVIAARNAGLAKTDADAVGFCEPVDVWKPEKLQKHLMHLCQNQEAGVSFAELHDIGNTDQPDTAQPKPRRVNMTAAYVFRHNPLRHKSGSVIRRESLKALMLKPKNASPHNQGFDETLEEYAKQDAWLRLLLTTGWSIEGLPSPFVTRHTPGALRPAMRASDRPPTVILGVAQRGKKAQTWITHIKHLRFDPQPHAKGCSLNEPPAAVSHQSRSVLA